MRAYSRVLVTWNCNIHSINLKAISDLTLVRDEFPKRVDFQFVSRDDIPPKKVEPNFNC